MDLCQYKDSLGRPGEGFHRHMAVGDIVGTLGGAYLISYYVDVHPLIIFMLLMLISIPIHMLFCVDTELVKMVKAAPAKSTSMNN
jgi:hypothetical protein